MANSNVNIASKLYAYIRHGVDINDQIKDVYRNSMIFIGDEQQIYVPVMDTYVGIGMTAYNATLDRITDLEGRINEVAETLSRDLVSKLYANYSFDDLTFNKYVRESDKNQANGAAFDTREDSHAEEYWQLNNEVTIKGINDYDPETGFARTISNPYKIKDSEGHEYRLDEPSQWGNSDYYFNAADGRTAYNARGLYANYNDTETYTKVATSGITVTPVWGALVPTYNAITGQTTLKRLGNRIEIDDSLTWSYMTSAYAYTLNYSQLYTNSEIERVYHNLLGEPEAIYVPVSFKSVVEDITDHFNSLTTQDQERYAATYNIVTRGGVETPAGSAEVNGVETYWLSYNTYTSVYKIKDGEYYWSAYSTDVTSYEVASVVDGTLAYAPMTVSYIAALLDEDNSNDPDWAVSDGETGDAKDFSDNNDGHIDTIKYQNSEREGFPQIYIKDTQYNSTYNMNIKDGIETLKEVAYLLDILSDGTLGSTTYVTYGDWAASYWDLTDESNPVTYTGWTGPVDTTDHVGNPVHTYTYTNADSISTTYTIIPKMDNDEIHPKDSDIYAFYTNTGENAENLGIQIAYSIAGNKQQIDDLHSHTDLLEKGETTLRSIQSTSNEFAEVTLVGGTTHWTDTDSYQGESNFGDETSEEPRHPNYQTTARNAQNSYLVGDVNIQVHLNTAKVYATTYTTGAMWDESQQKYSAGTPINYYFKDEFGVIWFGAYTMADMNNLPVLTGNDNDDTAYYMLPKSGQYDQVSVIYNDGTTPDADINFENIDNYAPGENHPTVDYIKGEFGDPITLGHYIQDPRKQGAGLQYWYKPEASDAINDNSQNLKYKVFTVEDYLGLGDNDEVNSAGLTKVDNYTVYYKDTTTHTYEPYSVPANDLNGKAAFNAQWTAQNNDNNYNGHVLSLDEKIYIIDPGAIDKEKVKLHAVVGENALATTEWVGAYVESVVESISEELENILEEAKAYTREQIAKLDKDYKYSDFEEYWNNLLSEINSSNEPYAWGTESGQTYSVAAVTQPGSPEYKSAYEIEYNKYKESPYVFTYEGSTTFRLSYATNSQYVYNTVEEDGIVTPETRELPTDELSVKTRVWGDEQNEGANAVHVYADVVIDNPQDSDSSGNIDQVPFVDAPGEANGSQHPLFMALYNWMTTAENGTPSDDSDDFDDNQLFVADGTTYRPLPVDSTSKAAIDAWLLDPDPSNPYYYYDSQLQQYRDLTLYINEKLDVMVHGNAAVFDYSNRNDKFWTLVYEKVDNYVEINLQKAKLTDETNTSDNLVDALKIENEDGTYYVLTKTTPSAATSTITVTKVQNDGTTAVSGFTATTLKYIDKKADKKVEYLTVENHHYSFVENGNGENKFEITAHITKLEDATVDNTGFADAFDVQTYVKNFFTWVDISASISDDIINSSDIYYKEISLAKYEEMIESNETPDLYVRTTSNDSVNYAPIAAANLQYAWYWKDDNQFAGSGSQGTLANGGTSVITVDFENETVGGVALSSREDVGNHVTIAGNYFYKQFRSDSEFVGEYAEGNMVSNYYIRLEEPKLNPLNLTLTEYGK